MWVSLKCSVEKRGCLISAKEICGYDIKRTGIEIAQLVMVQFFYSEKNTGKHTNFEGGESNQSFLRLQLNYVDFKKALDGISKLFLKCKSQIWNSWQHNIV